MTSKQAKTIDTCINRIEECINDGPTWNQAAWESVVDHIDLKIEAKRTEIAALQKARKLAKRCLRDHETFDWDRAALGLHQIVKRRNTASPITTPLPIGKRTAIGGESAVMK